MRRIRQNYHFVVASVIFVQMILFGGFLNTISIFTVPISESLGINRSGFALSQVFRNCSSFVSTLFVGIIYRRFGFRKSGFAFALSATASIALVAVSRSMVTLCLGYCLFGLSIGMLSTNGAVCVIKEWFHKRQGTVLGFVTMATGFGGSLLSKLLSGITEQHSWRHAHFFICGMLVFLALLILLVRNRPADMGLHPYGLKDEPQTVQTVSAEHTDWVGHSFQELLRLPQFYLMILCVLLSCASVYIPFGSLVPHLQDLGYSPASATNYHSVLLIVLSFAKLFGGWLCDKIGAKTVTILALICGGIGQYLLAEPSGPIAGYTGVCLLSLALLTTTLTVPLLTMPLFGYRAFGSIVSIFMATISLGSMLSSPIANLTYDHLGSYTPAIYVSSFMQAGIVLLFLLLYYLCDREKKKQLKEKGASA